MDAQRVLSLARESIRAGLERGRPAPVALDPGDPLGVPAACFVSLHLGDELRGCIGTTEAAQPLAVQVAEYAYAAAFGDPRFPPLTRAEFEQLTLEVHVLGALEPITFVDLPDLCRQLRPRIDGLQLQSGARRGLFLPVMWDSLVAPQEFVGQLLRKAGIRETAGLRASRFSATVLK